MSLPDDATIDAWLKPNHIQARGWRTLNLRSSLALGNRCEQLLKRNQLHDGHVALKDEQCCGQAGLMFRRGTDRDIGEPLGHQG